IDFRLPDLAGNPISFKDLDADFILLDFWGTWCGYCVEAIPHLVQLQDKYDPKRIRIVGVAYEQGPVANHARLVERTSNQLGINYPSLLSENDGRPCPLQAALHIQSYPTMILLDRHGRILWRDTGSNSTTLARLDRVLASKLDSGVV